MAAENVVFLVPVACGIRYQQMLRFLGNAALLLSPWLSLSKRGRESN
jgi:hypothetical protein